MILIAHNSKCMPLHTPLNRMKPFRVWYGTCATPVTYDCLKQYREKPFKGWAALCNVKLLLTRDKQSYIVEKDFRL